MYICASKENYSLLKFTKMKVSAIQKEINLLAKLNLVSGEVTLNIIIPCENYAQLNDKQNEILSQIICPEGFKQNDNFIYRKGFSVWLYFSRD